MSTSTDACQWRDSELVVYGRSVSSNEADSGAPALLLPKSSALLLPENADEIRIVDRQRQGCHIG